jgi:large repetitive protein
MASREQRLNKIGTITVISLLAGGFAFAAARADGFKATKVKLHDSGIWLVKTDVIGRFNHDLQKVDTQSATFADGAIDLQQVDSTVIVTTKTAIHRFNVALDATEGAVTGTPLPPDAVVSIGGDNGALLEPKTGRVWFTSGEALAGVKTTTNDGFVELDGAKQLVVGTDGVAHVYAPETGNLWTLKELIKGSESSTADPNAAAPGTTVPLSVPPTVGTKPTGPSATTLPVPKTVKNVTGDLPMTTAGDRVVFLDAQNSAVVLDDGTSVKIDGLDGDAKLQQPSPDRSHVVVATSNSLMLVDLGSHTVRALGKDNISDTTGDGHPINPVSVSGCSYGAWTTHTVRYCNDARLSEVAQRNAEVPLRFRTNHGLVALNYVSGAALDMSDDGAIQPLSAPDWNDALKPENKKQQQFDPNPTDQVDSCAFDKTKPNTAPVAVPDSFGVRRTDPTILDVLSGLGSDGKPDTDTECDALTVSLPKALGDKGGVLDGDGGTVSVIKNGRQLQYSPPAADKKPSGPITFTYELSDGRSAPVAATVTLNFVEKGQNAAPVPHDDATSVAQGKNVQLNVLGNDFDPDGDPLVVTNASIVDAQGTAVGVNGPDGDALVWQANGRISYRAPAAVTKTEKLSYEVSDGHGGAAKAVVSIAVIPGGGGQNKPPNTINDAVIGVAGQNLSVDVLANDSDPNNDVLRVTKLEAIDSGTPTVAKWGDTVSPGLVGLDTAKEGVYNYAYQVDDGNGGNAWGRVRFTVLVAGANHSPVAVRDDAVIGQSQATLIDVLGNDGDIDGDVMMITAITPGTNDADVNSSDALSVEVLEHRILRVTTKGAAEPSQTYRFAYTVSDGQASSSAVVSVRVAAPSPGQAPVTKPDQARVHLGGVVGIPVLANDYDPDGNPIVIKPGSAKIVGADSTNPGQMFIEGDLVVYVAPSSAARKSGFTVNAEYQVSDGQHDQRETIQIDVVDLAENQAPAPADLLVRVFANDQGVEIPLPRFGLDPDGDPVQILSRIPDATRAAKGDVRYDDKKVAFIYDAGAIPGQDEFSYEVVDSPESGVSKTGHITIRVTVANRGDNAPPVAVDDVFDVKTGQATALAVLANDTDPDGDAIAFAPTDNAVEQPASNGSAALSTSDLKHVIFTATGADKSTADFSYHIVDGQGHAAVGTVHVNLLADGPANRAPVAKDDPQPPAHQEDVLTIDVLANDKDAEGDPLSVQCPAGSESFCKTVSVKDPNGTDRQGLRVTMGATSLSFSYLLSDASHPDEATGAVRAAVQIPLAPKNQPPVCEALSKNVGPTDPDPLQVTIDVAVQCHDPDIGDVVIIGPDTKPKVTQGDLILTATDLKWNQASFAIGRHLEQSGEVVIEYTVQDSKKAAAIGTIVLKITGKANTPPTAAPKQQIVFAGDSPIPINLNGTAVTDPDPGDQLLLRFSGATTPDASYLTSSITPDGVMTIAAPSDTIVTDQTGPKTLTIDYLVNDTHGADVKGAVIVTIRPNNKPGPIAKPDIMPVVKQGGTSAFNVLANDLPGDPSLNKLEVVSTTAQATGPSGPAGTAQIDAAGNAVFTPTPGFHGTAMFKYTIQDQRHSPTKQSTSTVTVDVQDKPSKPAQPSVGAQQTTAADVTFAAAQDNGSPITSYVISWNGGKKDCGAAAGHCIIPGLTNGTSYQFQVTAINGVGPSDLSDLSQPYTPDQVPDQPPQPQANWDDKSATVTWAGIVNPGSPLVAVRIDVSPPDVPSFTASGTASGSHQFTGLNNGTPYTFTLTAINSAKPNGQSKQSSASSPVVPAGNPGPVGTPILLEGDGQVTASWGAADPNGDPGGLTYTVKLLNGTTVEQTVGPLTATSKTIQATNGQTYTVIVEINNKFTAKTGSAVVSPASSPIVPSGHPIAPTALTVLQNQDGALKIHIGSTNNNGADLDHYTVTGSNGTSKTFPADPKGAATDVVYPGLTNGTKYTFTVTAHNKNGDGASTASSNDGTPFGTPQAPTVSCSHNGSFITCNWSINGINGPAPATTTVTMDDGFTSPAPSGTHTTASLPYSTTKTMTVKVCNNGASVSPPGGVANPCQTATAQDTSAAAPPLHVSCSGGASTINCNWSITGLVGTDPHTSTVDVNGTVVANNQDSGGWSSGNIGSAATRTMTFRECNSSLQCQQASASATTDPPPKVVNVSLGNLQGKCAVGSSNCYYITVSVSGFSSGIHAFSCFGGQTIAGKVWSGTFSVGNDGNGYGSGSFNTQNTSPYCSAATVVDADMTVS